MAGLHSLQSPSAGQRRLVVVVRKTGLGVGLRKLVGHSPQSLRCGPIWRRELSGWPRRKRRSGYAPFGPGTMARRLRAASTVSSSVSSDLPPWPPRPIGQPVGPSWLPSYGIRPDSHPLAGPKDGPAARHPNRGPYLLPWRRRPAPCPAPPPVPRYTLWPKSERHIARCYVGPGGEIGAGLAVRGSA